MYNEKVLSQLKELNYLHVIKNSNVNYMSKKNTFGDMVKFYAQINSENVIQKISYKASGCTYFLVFCNHFCNIVEGKTIDEAIKINVETLEQFVELEDNRKHVANIIIDTFALLIKKYRKGVEKGLITPIQVEEVKKETSTKEDVKKEIKLSIKEHKDTNKTVEKQKLEKSKKEKIINKETKPVNEKSIKQASNIMALKTMVKSSETADKKKSETKTSKNEVDKLSTMINKISAKKEQPVEDENTKKLHSISANLASMRKVSAVKEDKKEVKSENVVKVKENKKINNKSQEDKKKSVMKTQVEKKENAKKIQEDKKEKRDALEEKKKKGLFSWLRKK
jgi:NifU-like protein involved in Fe-S cluster formation